MRSLITHKKQVYLIQGTTSKYKKLILAVVKVIIVFDTMITIKVYI